MKPILTSLILLLTAGLFPQAAATQELSKELRSQIGDFLNETARKEICSPNYMLKLQPNYDGSPRIAEIIRTQTSDCEILEAWSGDARLQLFEHVNCPLGDLPVKEIVSCSHILTNLTLGQSHVIYNYLK